jgi:hypothetical protein
MPTPRKDRDQTQLEKQAQPALVHAPQGIERRYFER